MVQRGKEERVFGVKCPNCGQTENIFVCQPCGRQKYRCRDCNYLGYPKRFIKVS